MVMRDAVDNLTPVVLELGGKDAAVLCDDCDYDQVHFCVFVAAVDLTVTDLLHNLSKCTGSAHNDARNIPELWTELHWLGAIGCA